MGIEVIGLNKWLTGVLAGAVNWYRLPNVGGVLRCGELDGAG